jgi:hypothetical protein
MQFFNMQDASETPALCEPLFMELNAEIELLPVMNCRGSSEGAGRCDVIAEDVEIRLIRL